MFVTWINIRRYEDQNRAVIQINVDSEKGVRLLERGFWPEGVVCRPWYTRNVYRQKLISKSYRAEMGTDVYKAAMDNSNMPHYSVNVD